MLKLMNPKTFGWLDFSRRPFVCDLIILGPCVSVQAAMMASESQNVDSEAPTLYNECCCGDQIMTTVLGRQRKAWIACGLALKDFETNIMPHIGPIIRNVDLGDADLYMRLYMVGKSQQTASPMIAVICADVKVAKSAKQALKTSSLLIKDYPAFSIGRFPRPLGHSTQIRPLAANIEPISANLDFSFQHEPSLLSTTYAPNIGRPLVLASATSRYATGGVVTHISGSAQYFQLTAGHVFEMDTTTRPPRSLALDDDSYSFDGQSEDEEADRYALSDVDGLSFASQSFCSDDDEFLDQDSVFSAPVPGETTFAPYPTLANHNRAVGSFRADPDALVDAGTLSLHSREGDNPELDYAMIAIDQKRWTDKSTVNIINAPETPNKVLRIRQIGSPKPGRKTRILAVTTSGDVTSGLILPGMMYVRKPNKPQFQSLFVVRLDGPLEYGDSGSVVVDENCGDLYGHVISGCASANTAYVIPAREVFDDINRILRARMNTGPNAETLDLRISGREIASGGFTLDQHPNLTLEPPCHSNGEACNWKMRGILFLLCLYSIVFFLPFFLILFNIIQSSMSLDSTPWWDASTTNYALSLANQLFTLSFEAWTRYITKMLIEALAKRYHGDPFMSWILLRRSKWNLGDIQASPWVLGTYVASNMGWLTVGVMVSGLLLKYDASYEDYYFPTTPEISIYGQRPFTDTLFGNHYPHISGLLHDNRYAVNYHLPGCAENCTGYLLLADLMSFGTPSADDCDAHPWRLDSRFIDSEAIKIDGAPGHIVEFRELDRRASNFEIDTNCFRLGFRTTDGGRLAICSKQSGVSIDTGLARYQTSLPNSLEWISISRITTYTALTKTIYNANDTRILRSSPKSGASLIPLDASDYMAKLERVLLTSHMKGEERSASNSIFNARDTMFDYDSYPGLAGMLFSSEWAIRVELSRSLRNSPTPPRPPRNLFAMPIWLIINSCLENSTTFIASAQGVKSGTRLVIMPWAGWIYIGTITGCIIVLWCLYGSVLWMSQDRDRRRAYGSDSDRQYAKQTGEISDMDDKGVQDDSAVGIGSLATNERENKENLIRRRRLGYEQPTRMKGNEGSNK